MIKRLINGLFGEVHYIDDFYWVEDYVWYVSNPSSHDINSLYPTTIRTLDFTNKALRL